MKRIAIVLLLFVVVFCVVDIKELQEENTNLKNRISEVNREVSREASKLKSCNKRLQGNLTENKQLERTLNIEQSKVRTLNRRVSELKTSLSGKNKLLGKVKPCVEVVKLGYNISQREYTGKYNCQDFSRDFYYKARDKYDIEKHCNGEHCYNIIELKYEPQGALFVNSDSGMYE